MLYGRATPFLLPSNSPGQRSSRHVFVRFMALKGLSFVYRYPEGLGWQLNVQKTIVRKSLEFKKFQDFLVYETDVVSSLQSSSPSSGADFRVITSIGKYLKTRGCQHDPSPCVRRSTPSCGT